MWFRKNEVDILKYLPDFLSKDVNFKSVGDTNSLEHEKIRLLIQDIHNQYFIETATWGLSVYEKILDITPNPGDDYTARRNRILLRYQSSNTSTLEFMQMLLERYVAEDTKLSIVENNSKYNFSVICDNGNITDLNGMFEALDLYRPAHLSMNLKLRKEVTSADKTFYIGLLNFQGGIKKVGLPFTTQGSFDKNIGLLNRLGGVQKINISIPTIAPVTKFTGVLLCKVGKITI